MRAAFGPLLLVILIASTFPLLQAGRALRAPEPLPQRWEVDGGCLGSGAWEVRQSGVFLHLIGAEVGGAKAVIRGRIGGGAPGEPGGVAAALEGEVRGGACEGAQISGKARWQGAAWEGEVTVAGCADCPSARLTGQAGR